LEQAFASGGMEYSCDLIYIAAQNSRENWLKWVENREKMYGFLRSAAVIL
jgi:hypothetical protein